MRKIILEIIRWRPIETAPKDGTQVLLARSDGIVGCGRWEDVRGVYLWVGEWSSDTKDVGLKPTRWMPLPEPPE